MRVALGLWGNNLSKAFETYNIMSTKLFTHATPTLFNCGTPRPQLSSCFLLSMKDDSITGIYDTLKDCAMISKFAGGIGLHIHNIRASGSRIYGTNGTSNGIVPMLRNFNMTARYVDQGGGKRNGSFAIYLEPWHADIQDFLKLKLNNGNEEERCRDLFYAVWVPDHPEPPGLADTLSHGNAGQLEIHYIGILSRMEYFEEEIEYDLAVVLSGPEPQRTYLENKLLEQILALPLKSIVIRGKTHTKEHYYAADHVELVSYLTSKELNKVLLASK
jgi:hypothetical protein